MPELPLTGGCLCGGVRFEVTEPLVRAATATARAASAARGAAASARRASRRVAAHRRGRGADPLLAARGGFAKCFCSECGSALWSRDPDDSDVISVRLGAFDADPGIRPECRQFVAYAAQWEPIPDDGLPRFPEQRR